MICKQYKRIEKSSVFFAFLLVSTAISLGYLLYRFDLLRSFHADPLNFLETTLFYSYFIFFFFLFFSFEFSYKLKENNVTECLEFSKIADAKFFSSAGGALFLFLLVYTIVLFIVNVVMAHKLDVLRTEYVTHMGINLFLNITLIGNLGIAMGSTFATFGNRIAAYLSMILSAILVSPLNELISVPLAHFTQLNVFSFFDIFNIFPPLLGATPLHPFGYSILPYRFYLILFWSFLFLGIVVTRVWKTTGLKKVLISIMFFVIAVLCFSLYLLPASKVTRDKLNQKTGIFSDVYYYEKHTFEKEEASFDVTSYDLDLNISQKLKAVCTVTANRPFKNQDTFTLFHGFRVEKILDEQNEAVDYRQDGDYITILQEKEDLKTLSFYYSGASVIFYANTQAVFLPGNFPYYPFPGKIQLYSLEMQSFLPNQLREVAEFKVTLKTSKILHSNLSKVGFNQFVGRARSLSLLGGMYEIKTGYGSKTLLIPYLARAETNEDTIQSEIQMTLANDPTFKEIKKIMLIPNVNFVSVYAQYLRFDDYVLTTQIRGLDVRNLATRIPWQKSTLFSVLQNYQHFRDVYQHQMQSFQEELKMGGEESAIMKTYLSFQECLNHFGEQSTIASIEVYLEDGSDERSGLEYLFDLLEEKGGAHENHS